MEGMESKHKQWIVNMGRFVFNGFFSATSCPLYFVFIFLVLIFIFVHS